MAAKGIIYSEEARAKLKAGVDKPALPSWYRPRRGDIMALRILTQRQGGGIRALAISGPPGVGKTAFAKAVAEALGAGLFYFLAHHWVSEEDLFVKVDPARVAGLAGGVFSEMEEAYRPGVLLRATLSSQERPTVLLLDEWDKAPERADALLLDFLQDGAVRGPFGEEWVARSENLLVILTDNGLRPLSEPLLRRVYRYRMGFLPPEVEADLIRRQSGVGVGVARTIVRMMTVVREKGVSSPSLQEGVRLAQSLPLCEGAEDVYHLVLGFLVKEDEDWEALQEAFGKHPEAVLWGERRRGGK